MDAPLLSSLSDGGRLFQEPNRPQSAEGLPEQEGNNRCTNVTHEIGKILRNSQLIRCFWEFISSKRTNEA